MTIRVQVDATNPGQFFACCGLLELADRLWQGAEGWFENGAFRIENTGTLRTALDALIQRKPDEVLRLSNDIEVKPLIAPLKLTLGDENPVELLLDGWMTVRLEKGVPTAVANPPWNFWSGQQTSLRIWEGLREALTCQIRNWNETCETHLFEQRVLVTGRFGFDPGPAWNALDAGFSPNDQRLEVASSAAVELLAAVGLQRFRPRFVRRDRFTYATWGMSLPPEIASVAFIEAVSAPPAKRYLGRVTSRGSYAALGYSSTIEGDNHD